jgi:hypothetical protein
MKARAVLLFCFSIVISLTTNIVNGQTTYLHTDREYYSPGDPVYFKAYFLGVNQIKDTLHVALIDHDGLEVAYYSFPVDNNLYASKIDVPDFAKEGTYMLVASTGNTSGATPQNMFSKVVDIINTDEEETNATISLTDTLYKPGSELTAYVRITGSKMPVVFSYRMAGPSGDLLSGKEKTTAEGSAVLKLQLPQFTGDPKLELLVLPLFKGNKKVTAISVPTGQTHCYKNQVLRDHGKKLNINISTSKQLYTQNEDVQLSISVTDASGQPVMANLSVSASKSMQSVCPFDYNNILEYLSFRKADALPFDKNAGEDVSDLTYSTDIRNYFAKAIDDYNLVPGRNYIVQEKNDLKKIKKKRVEMTKTEGYSSERNIMDIIMQIKPYHLESSGIVFGLKTMNSFSNQDGAMIVVDGIKYGTDPSVLRTIPVTDIAHINVSTNVMDTQKYSALNSVGVIEITTKKSKAFTGDNGPVSKGNTLFWQPDLIIDGSGKKVISFANDINTKEVIINVNGINGEGITGSTSLHYSVAH